MDISFPPAPDLAALRAVISKHHTVLLDFDGPVCSVFSGYPNHVAAQALRTALGVTHIPDSVQSSNDPFRILQFAATLSFDLAAELERHFALIELEAVQSASPTPGAEAAIARLKATGHEIAIVSNNSENAIRAYLDRRSLDIPVVSGRCSANLAHLKPAPFLLWRAISQLGVSAEQCAFVGDSVTDIQAARSAHVAPIGFANKPGKSARFAHFQPVAIIRTMTALADAA